MSLKASIALETLMAMISAVVAAAEREAIAMPKITSSAASVVTGCAAGVVGNSPSPRASVASTALNCCEMALQRWATGERQHRDPFSERGVVLPHHRTTSQRICAARLFSLALSKKRPRRRGSLGVHAHGGGLPDMSCYSLGTTTKSSR